jgi:hypothetical protein
MTSARTREFVQRCLTAAPDECVVWPHAVDGDGYALAWHEGRNHRVTHLVLIAAGHERPPEGHALHSCDRPSCCSLPHLRWGDNLDNVGDRDERKRQAYGERHGRAVLTNEQAAAIRADTRVQRVIAAEYGIARSTVSMIQTDRRYQPR